MIQLNRPGCRQRQTAAFMLISDELKNLNESDCGLYKDIIDQSGQY